MIITNESFGQKRRPGQTALGVVFEQHFPLPIKHNKVNAVVLVEQCPVLAKMEKRIYTIRKKGGVILWILPDYQ